MCQAIEEWIQEEKEEGKKQGIEEGKKQGIEEGKKQGIEEGIEEGIGKLLEYQLRSGMITREQADMLVSEMDVECMNVCH